jgi:Predicted integral membrane protein
MKTKNDMKKSNINKTSLFLKLNAIAILFWLALIFHFSAQPAIMSGGLSKGITKEMVVTAEKVGIVAQGKSMDKFFISKMDDKIRSCAHFFMFFILGFLTYSFSKTLSKKKCAILPTFLFCSIYAMLDEFHQYFVPGRAVQLSDFITDCCGSALGIAIFAIMYKFYVKYSNKVHVKL